MAGGLFREGRPGARALVGVAVGIAVAAGASAVLGAVIDGPVALATYGTTAAVSLGLALVVTAASEWVFPPVQPAVPEAPVEQSRGIRAEDADVDELLSMIASAEEELATRHKAEAVVLITDMKSFSAMTEEVGSIESAKLVQRHRDLLLPVVERHGGPERGGLSGPADPHRCGRGRSGS